MNSFQFVLPMALVLGAAACSRAREITPGVPWYPLSGPLIPARMTMVAAWDVPKNPLADPTLDDSRLSKEIRWGYRIFTNTPGEAGRLTPSKMSCTNCHLNAGQREKGLPLVAVAGLFPEYNKRAGHLIALADRVVDCFQRSENGMGLADANAVASPTDREVVAVTAYLAWLSRGYDFGQSPPWRGQNVIPTRALIPVEKLDSQKGEALFMERCTSCHATDGQGVAVGDKKPGPLWGPDSWNDGAALARPYTLAGMIRYSMPYLDPGSLTDEKAQHIAFFIDSKPRPSYPFKDRDFRIEPMPVDSVYYARR